MSKSTLLSRLQELGVHPSKMLGQNFLLDPNLAQAIVASIEPSADDHVVEIGPGMGALTEYLVHSPAGRITLLERDHRFVEELKKRYGSDRVQVIGGDAAKIDLRQLYGWGSIKVIGNLPYSASTAIIAHFTEPLSPACKLVFMLQREVAERLVAHPGDQDYAALTILLGRRWSVKKTRIVPPEVFWPRPHVESAIVEIVPRRVTFLSNSTADAISSVSSVLASSSMSLYTAGLRALVPSSSSAAASSTKRSLPELIQCNEAVFKKIVKLGFSSRRKKLGSLLKKEYPMALEVLEKLGHSPTVRGEDLGLQEWSLLANKLVPPCLSSSKELADVVDATDELLEVLAREVIHVNKLRHRAVHVLLFNKKGELFLQKRSFWKENHPGLWCSSAAGHLMAGESYLAAAQREVEEELGVLIEPTPFARLEASPLTGEEFIECFYGISEGPFEMEPYELETGAFFSLPLIERWMRRCPEEFTPVVKMILEKINFGLKLSQIDSIDARIEKKSLSKNSF